MKKRVPVLKDGKVLRDENGNVLEFNAVNQEELDRKIDAPQTATVGEVLTVEEVDEDGKPTKWKTQTVETEPPDWAENDSAKPGYIKNRTHYDSRRTVELFNVTVENVGEDGYVKLADADIDISKITRLQVNSQHSVNDEVNTFTFDSDGGNVKIEDDPDIDDAVVIRFTVSEDNKAFLFYFKTSKAADEFTNTTGVYSPGLYVNIYQGDIIDTFIGYSEVGELKTIDPKFIEDMYYSEIKNAPLTGYAGWAKVVGEHSGTIPFVEVKGVRYENIKSYEDNQYVRFNIDGHSINMDRGLKVCGVNWDGITEDDLIFGYGDVTFVHPIPEKYIPDTMAKKSDIVQANWNITDESDARYIWGKPSFYFSKSTYTSTAKLDISLLPYTGSEQYTYFKNIRNSASFGTGTYLKPSPLSTKLCLLKDAVGKDIFAHSFRLSNAKSTQYVTVIAVLDGTSIVGFAVCTVNTRASLRIVSSDGQTLNCDSIYGWHR